MIKSSSGTGSTTCSVCVSLLLLNLGCFTRVLWFHSVLGDSNDIS